MFAVEVVYFFFQPGNFWGLLTLRGKSLDERDANLKTANSSKRSFKI